MKKIILFSVIALFLSAMGGCEKDEKKKKTVYEYYDCETDRPIYETLESELATIQYGYNDKKMFVIILDNSNNKWPLFPCGNSLPKEYQKVGLKVKVSGVCRNCTPFTNNPTIKIAPLFKINITSIKKY